jgi:lipopolysaccharide transport system ATP-binding protein
MEPVIQLNNIGKTYIRNKETEGRPGFKTLLKTITNFNKTGDFFWALSNISLNIMPGEVVGIIGKNGSGKSTLLKILSRITAPTTGNAIINGRIGSLLEVGTGFHPELTGRENIYLNGYILGMSKTEIDSKFSKIVEFSGVQNFIDTPIKRYSSGMQARLAFAVAAHLESEILIVDEVLAVGDAEFQKRCMGKMHEVASAGRTVLFVSHNMNAIRNLCTRCIWIKNGQVYKDSEDVDWVVGQYLTHFRNSDDIRSAWVFGLDHKKDHQLIPKRLFMADNLGNQINREIASDELISIEIEFECLEPIFGLSIGYALYDENFNLIYMTYSNDSNLVESTKFEKGEYKISSLLPDNILNDGEYTLQLIAGIHNTRPIFSRETSDIFISLIVTGNKMRSSTWTSSRPSVIAPVIKWQQERLN